jgi:hypothetical protein
MKLHYHHGVEHCPLRHTLSSRAKPVGHMFRLTGEAAALIDLLVSRTGWEAQEVCYRALQGLAARTEREAA